MLIIIDMQTDFIAAHDPGTIQNIVSEIREAKHNNDIIVLVEYGESGNTVVPIIQELEHYDNVYYVYKYRDDGSNDILNSIRHVLKKRDIIRVCGVNTTACVHDTVQGLLRKVKNKIHIVKECCYDDFEGADGFHVFGKFKKNKNFCVIH